MNKFFALTKRNFLEIIRDPLSLVFCVAFPLFMLVLLQVIFLQFDTVPPNFLIENYSVGICVFSYSFVALFVANLIAGDKNSEFINRLKMAPISDFCRMLSYVVAVFPIAVVQTVLLLAVSLFFGLPFSVDLLLALIFLIPSALFYILLGVLIGVLSKNEKQSGSLSSIITSCVGIFAGIFMPLSIMGTFSDIMNFLPFVHTVNIAAGVFVGDYACFLANFAWVLCYSAVVLILIWLIGKKR